MKCLIKSSDVVSRLGLGPETRFEIHFCESRSRSRRLQVLSLSRFRRFQVSRLWILQRNGLLKFI